MEKVVASDVFNKAELMGIYKFMSIFGYSINCAYDWYLYRENYGKLSSRLEPFQHMERDAISSFLEFVKCVHENSEGARITISTTIEDNGIQFIARIRILEKPIFPKVVWQKTVVDALEDLQKKMDEVTG